MFESSVPSIYPWDDFSIFSFLLVNQNKFNRNIQISRCKAFLKSIPVQFLNLHKIKASVKNCERFSMAIYDDMINKAIDFVDSPIEIHSLWEYPCRAIGEMQTLLEIELKCVKPKYKTNVVKKASAMELHFGWNGN